MIVLLSLSLSFTMESANQLHVCASFGSPAILLSSVGNFLSANLNKNAKLSSFNQL